MMASQQWRDVERAVELDDHVRVKALARIAAKGANDLSALESLVSLGARLGAVRSVQVLVRTWQGIGGVEMAMGASGGAPLASAATCRSPESSAALTALLLPLSKDPGNGAQGREPLLIAAVKGHVETSKLLIASHFYRECLDWQGNTLLHCAVLSGSCEMLAVALAAPRSAEMLSLKNNLGMTPSSLARAMFYPEIQEALAQREEAAAQVEELMASCASRGMRGSGNDREGKRRARI